MSILNLNSPQGRSPRSKKSTKIWMGVGLLAAVLGVGSTFASTITINSASETTEFGQGVQRTVYCGGDSQILKVIPITAYRNKSGSTDPAGTFYVSGIKVSEIPDACDGVNFVISMYNGTAGSSPLALASTSARTVTNPTVYWRAGSSSSYLAGIYMAKNNSSSVSSCASDSQLASTASGSAGQLTSSTRYGAILSLDRDVYTCPATMAYLTVSDRAFQINFKVDSTVTNTDVALAARLVIETQEDGLGMLTVGSTTGKLKTTSVAGTLGLVHSGTSTSNS
jgi:hypothetical protein